MSRYAFGQCQCGAPGCDNYVVTDNCLGAPIPTCFNLSKSQAEAVTEILNQLAHTNNQKGENQNTTN